MSEKALVTVDLKLGHSQEMRAWFAKCPNPGELSKIIADIKWMENKVNCESCGEKKRRKNMRWNRANPAVSDNELICKSCWEGWQEGCKDDGTMGNPTWRVPPWPAQLDRYAMESDCVESGVLLHSKSDEKSWVRIGQVKEYCPRSHIAQLVTLDSQPDNAETGSLDPHDAVYDPTRKLIYKQHTEPVFFEYTC